MIKYLDFTDGVSFSQKAFTRYVAGSGIYAISCNQSDKVYIGSAELFADRFAEHRVLLRKGTHYNIHLQRAYNKYGEASFVFTSIEDCILPIEWTKKEKRKLLLFREQKCMDKLLMAHNPKEFRKHAYNMKPNADGGHCSLNAVHKKKTILVFDLNMGFIEEIYGAIDASKKYNNANVIDCCKGNCISSKGYTFRYKGDIFPMRKKIKSGWTYRTKRARKAYQYNALTGEFIKEWRCYSDASEEVGYSASYILANIEGRNKSVGIYIFKRDKVDKISPIVVNLNKIKKVTA